METEQTAWNAESAYYILQMVALGTGSNDRHSLENIIHRMPFILNLEGLRSYVHGHHLQLARQLEPRNAVSAENWVAD